MIYHVEDVPSDDPAIGNLPELIDGTASDAEPETLAQNWHGRVEAILRGE